MTVTNSVFTGGADNAISIYRDNYATSAIDVQITNCKFVGYEAAYAIDLNPGTYYQYMKYNLNMTAVSFTSKNGQFVNVIAGSTVTANAVTFDGSTNSGCGVSFTGLLQATMTKTVFSNKAGGPALCVTAGATVTTVACDFVSNNITANGAMNGAVYLSNAVYATSTSNYRTNNINSGEGGAIHCDNSHLTVGQSSFTSNKAPNAPAASCSNCVLVAFGNTNYRNSGGAQDACAL